MIKVAILGRPNVGKSTLFNRLAGRKLALVDDAPGVTRDRRETPATLGGDLAFTLIDTAGFHYDADEEMVGNVQSQIDMAVEMADLLLFVFDARVGLTPEDKDIAQILRRTNKPIIVLANKCEGKAQEQMVYEAHSLGFGEPIPISAEHGQGMHDLYDAVKPHIPEEDGEDEDAEKPLQFVILGRPNAGKSTLVNQYLKEDRVITGSTPGVTRDAITIDWTYKGKPLKLIDTAGMRKRARVTNKVEKLAVSDGLRALQYAHVAVLLVDATIALEKQDLTIARRIVDEGRILVIGINKWDLIKGDKKEFMDDLEYRLGHVLAQVKGVPFIPISAAHGTNVNKILDKAFELYETWNKRIPTAKLNQWLEGAEMNHPPPLIGRNRIRLKYATQIKTRPPTFVIFVSKALELPDSYKRYLENSLRDTFKMPGIPIRLQIRSGKNPYADKK